MKNLHKFIRGVFKPSRIFATGSPEIQQTEGKVESAFETFEKGFAKDKIPAGKDIDQSVENIAKQYHPGERYRTEAEKLVQKELPKSIDPEEKDRIVDESVWRYETVYDSAIQGLRKSGDELADKHSSAVEKITATSKEELNLLKDSTKNLLAVAKKRPNIREAIKENEVEDQFEAYVKALNEQYLNRDWQRETLKARGREDQIDEFEERASDFESETLRYTEGQVAHLLETVKDPVKLEESLGLLREYMTEMYKNLSNRDGFIELNDLRLMDRGSLAHLEFLHAVNSPEEDEKVLIALEATSFFEENQEQWETITEFGVEQMIEDAERNGAEVRFIAAVRKLVPSLPQDADFGDAVDAFEDEMELRVKAGPRKTLEGIRIVNEEVNGDRAQLLEFSGLKKREAKRVRRERELLLQRFEEPQNTDDIAVVEFMSTTLEGRRDILNSPGRREALFKAIQNMEHYYAKEVKKMKGDMNEKKARLTALVTLAKEARWVVGNFDQSEDMKSLALRDGLESMEVDKIPPSMDLNFRNVGTRYSTRFLSEVHRGGFNGRDIGLGVLKVWAGATLFLNVMNARSQGESWKDIPGIVAQNPYVYLTAGTFFATNELQKDPRAMKVVTGSPREREQYMTHRSLRKLTEKIGRKRINTFIAKSDEYNTMAALMENPKQGVKQVEKLLQKARKRNSKRPEIRKEDLENFVGPEVTQAMDDGDSNARYHFYRRFMGKERNIDELKRNCFEWGGITTT